MYTFIQCATTRSLIPVAAWLHVNYKFLTGLIIADDKSVINKHFFMLVCFVMFQPVHNADFIVPVEIDGTIHQVN